MADIPVGTYPYHKRHAIMEAVQAGLLPHTRQDGDEVHEGCVTVIVRVVPPAAMVDLLNFGPDMAPPIPTGTAPLTIKERWAACGVGMDRAELAFRYEATLHQQSADVPPDAARGCATKVTM